MVGKLDRKPRTYISVTKGYVVTKLYDAFTHLLFYAP